MLTRFIAEISRMRTRINNDVTHFRAENINARKKWLNGVIGNPSIDARSVFRFFFELQPSFQRQLESKEQN